MPKAKQSLPPIKIRLKRGDKVRVIAGKNKGEEGEIVEVHPNTHRVTIKDVNVIKKSRKTKQRDQQRVGFDEVEAPIHISNIQIIDPQTGESSRIGFKFDNGTKVRISKKSGAELDD